MKLWAIRGAITVVRDEKEVVVEATQRLVHQMLEKNEIKPQDVVSILFTATPDLRSEFPAAAAREMGLSQVPLLCACEIDVPGAIPRCIRALMHFYTTRDYTSLRHVYLEDARQLRTDLPE